MVKRTRLLKTGVLTAILLGSLISRGDNSTNSPLSLREQNSTSSGEKLREKAFGQVGQEFVPLRHPLFKAKGNFAIYTVSDKNKNGKYESLLGDKVLDNDDTFYNDDIICVYGNMKELRGCLLKWYLVDEKEGEVIAYGKNDWREAKTDVRTINGFYPIVNFQVANYHNFMLQERIILHDKIKVIRAGIGVVKNEEARERMKEKIKIVENDLEKSIARTSGIRAYSLGFYVDKGEGEKKPEYYKVIFINHEKADDR